MTDIVPDNEIERIVGTRRHATAHFGRAVSETETVYILHSEQCKSDGVDLRDCTFSLALDEGIDIAQWEGHEDCPVPLAVVDGRLVPDRSNPRQRAVAALINCYASEDYATICPHCAHPGDYAWAHNVVNLVLAHTREDDQ